MNPLTDEEVELTDSQIRGYQVFLLVEITYSGFWCFFNDHLKKDSFQTDMWFLQNSTSTIHVAQYIDTDHNNFINNDYM